MASLSSRVYKTSTEPEGLCRRFLFRSKCNSPKQNVVYVALFLMIIQLPLSKAGFVEVPFNQTLIYPSEMVAVSFRCRYEPQTRIVWLMNGTQFRSSPQSGIKSTFVTHDNGSVTEILTIPNNPLYNGTRVVCEASPELAPREVTPIAILIIVTDNQRMNSTFNEIPSPMLMVVTLDEQHTYKCSHPAADRISWRVNDIVLGADIFTISGIEYTDTISHPYEALYTLRITALPQNNESIIQCTALITADESPQISPVVTFLIQGLLQGVRSLERNTSTLSWKAPFSLDLTGIDPDIVYCVEVYNITCGRRDLIISDCNVTEPSYTSDDIMDGYIYEYAVTPRSNVEEASNGTSVTIGEDFVTLKSFKQNQLSMMGESEVILTIYASIHSEQALAESQINPKSCTISLTSIDGQNSQDGIIRHLPNVDIRNMSLVMFQVRLPFRRLWNYIVLAHGCDEHPLTNSTLLSTHDIQDVFITSPSTGKIWITGEFIPDSPAVGIAVAVLSISEVSFYFLRREGNHLHDEGVLSSVRGGQHMVSVFVVDRSGLPFNRTAIIPQKVVVNGSINQSFPIEYEVKPTSADICITCTFLDSSTTDCVAVVHQRISQLSSSGLMNIESRHKFNRSGDTASGCIEEFDIYRHQVGVIGGYRKQTPISMKESTPDSCSILCQALVGVILVILSLAVSIVIFITVLYIGRKRQKVRLMQQTAIHVSVDIPESDTRYETVQLKIQADSSGHTQAEIDTVSTTALPTVCGEGLPLDSAPSLPPPRSIDTDPVYTEAVTVSGSRAVHQQRATERVVYDDIKAFQNNDGQQYAIIGNLKTTRKPVDDPNLTVYSQIKHVLSSQQAQITDNSSQTKSTTQLKEDNDSTPKPVTLEHLLPELLPHASKWQSLGGALSFDEDQLDEIFTNNERDEACLQVMLEQYMAKSYLDHSWEEIQKALKQIGEELTIDQPIQPSGEDLKEQQVSKNQETASRTSLCEREDPTKEDHLLRVESEDTKDACDASQQGSNLCDNQQQHMDKDDYPSSFDEQADAPRESINQDNERFESGKGASPAAVIETASLMDDNRNVYDMNKSEDYSCAPVLFHAECEQQNLMVNNARRSDTYMHHWPERESDMDDTAEIVISSNWNFLKQEKVLVPYSLHSKDVR